MLIWTILFQIIECSTIIVVNFNRTHQFDTLKLWETKKKGEGR